MTTRPYVASSLPDPRDNTTCYASVRICLVTGELAGPDYNGGIGTAVLGLALALARRGYRVDILYTRVDRLRPFCFRGSFDQHVRALRKSNIRLRCIPHDGEWNDWLAKSYHVMSHLIAHRYDLVFFNDMHGAGYYSQLARKTASLELKGTIMVVVTHSATQWVTELNQRCVTSLEEVRLIEMERRSIELADAVISPSAYMLEKYRDYGWELPAITSVIPNLLPNATLQRPIEVLTYPIDEIVFFGRLERRKGLWLFCEALNRVKSEVGNVKVTFLGKMTEEDGELTGFALLRRSASWPFEVQILHDFDREQALNYLKGGRRVAVLPSPEDNSPCALLECLHEGVPFVSSRGSGGQELVAKECWEANLVEPTVACLSQKLRSLVRDGAATGRPATDPNQNEKAILNWVDNVTRDVRSTQRTSAASDVEAASDQHAPIDQLLFITTPNADATREVAQIERLLDLYPSGTSIRILSKDPEALIHRLPAQLSTSNFLIVDVRSFSEIIQSLSADSVAIGICHATQPFSTNWLTRAYRCLDQNREISALTGMAATPQEVRNDLPKYFGCRQAHHGPKEYRLGDSSAMFPLAQDTNSGFIVIRSDAISLVKDISPFDLQYEQFKRMQDWVHELVVRLSCHGRRSELIADCLLDAVLDEQPSSRFHLGKTTRSIINSHLGYAPGSEHALLARLGAETMIGVEQRRIVGERLAYMTDKLGRPLDDIALYTTKQKANLTLAAMARAAGQTELAHELLTYGLLPHVDRLDRIRSLTALVRQGAAEIRLYDLAASGDYIGLNLSHEWSFKILAGDRELEIHPNASSEGRAGVLFSGLDLTEAVCIRGTARLASAASRPVRFRIDLMSADGTSNYAVERVVRASQPYHFDELLPEDVRTTCDVCLSTEMASPSDQTEGAWARWTDVRIARL